MQTRKYMKTQQQHLLRSSTAPFRRVHGSNIPVLVDLSRALDLTTTLFFSVSYGPRGRPFFSLRPGMPIPRGGETDGTHVPMHTSFRFTGSLRGRESGVLRLCGCWHSSIRLREAVRPPPRRELLPRDISLSAAHCSRSTGES